MEARTPEVIPRLHAIPPTRAADHRDPRRKKRKEGWSQSLETPAEKRQRLVEETASCSSAKSKASPLDGTSSASKAVESSRADESRTSAKKRKEPVKAKARPDGSSTTNPQQQQSRVTPKPPLLGAEMVTRRLSDTDSDQSSPHTRRSRSPSSDDDDDDDDDWDGFGDGADDTE